MALPHDPQRIQIGSITVTILQMGFLRWDILEELIVPPESQDAEYAAIPTGAHIYPTQGALIESGDAKILVDVCSPAAFIGTSFESPNLAQPPEVTDQLRQMQIDPAAITHVIITHTHHDHFNGITTNPTAPAPNFPNATHMLGQADYADSDMVAALATPDSLEARTLGVVMDRHMMRLTTGDVEVIPGVQVLAAPGESAGHQIVRVADSGHILYVLGDLFHHASEVSHPEWMVTWADPQQMLASRQRLISAALREDALLVAAHISGIGRLERMANGVRWAAVT